MPAPTHLVTITMTAAGFSNQSKHLIESAEGPVVAIRKAIERTPHSDLDWQSDIDCFACGGSVHYQGFDAREVDPHDVDTLKKYL